MCVGLHSTCGDRKLANMSMKLYCVSKGKEEVQVWQQDAMEQRKALYQATI